MIKEELNVFRSPHRHLFRGSAMSAAVFTKADNSSFHFHIVSFLLSNLIRIILLSLFGCTPPLPLLFASLTSSLAVAPL